MKSIVVATEGINRYGFRVLMSGLSIESFRKNPIMLCNHDRGWSSDLPPGRWENMRFEESKLIGDPVFDEKDEIGAMMKQKWDDKFLFSASIGIRIIETSEDPSLMLPGQTRPTVTKCDLMEISLTDIPADPNATRVNLSTGFNVDEVLPRIELNQKPKTMSKQPSYAVIATALSLPADADEQKIVSAINKLTKEHGDFKTKLSAQLLADGKRKGVITEKTENHFASLIASDMDSVFNLVHEAAEPQAAQGAEENPQTIAQHLAAAGTAKTVTLDPNDRKNWTALDWSQKDPAGFKKMRTEDPERFDALAAAYQPPQK